MTADCNCHIVICASHGWNCVIGLAVAYDTGHVVILAVEKAGVLYTHNVNSIPTRLYWQATDEVESRLGVPLFRDVSEDMLPKLPNVNREYVYYMDVYARRICATRIRNNNIYIVY